MFTELANGLITEFGLFCEAPFVVEIREYTCGDEEPHAYAKIASVDANGCNIVSSSTATPAICLESVQYYAARNHDNPCENYMGMVTVRVFMYGNKESKSLSDNGGSHFAENPLMRPLLRLAMAHYYAVIMKEFPEWDTDYRDAPVICQAPWCVLD